MRLPLLDGLRGVAAIAVMLYHAHNMFPGLEAFSRSYLFVDMFFLLSGFVLGLAVDPKLRSGLSWHGFMRARWIRLWPMIPIGALVGAIPFALVNDTGTTAYYTLLAILLIPALAIPGVPYPLNAPQWSLAMEVVANLTHAVLLHQLSTASLYAISGISGVILAMLILSSGGNNFAFEAFSWPLAFARVGFAYTLGLAIARGHADRTDKAVPQEKWIGPFLLPIIALTALPLLPLNEALGDLAITLFVLPAAFLWATLARLPSELCASFTVLGSISYPLYAVHMPILALVASWRHDALGLGVALACCLGFAFLLARLLERRRKAETRKSDGEHALA